MTEVAAKPIQSPTHQHIEPFSLGSRDQLVERGTPILRPANTMVNVFDSRPTAILNVAPQLLELVA
jgi:hypothetical protein